MPPFVPTVFATVLVLIILVLGVAGYTQLGVDRFPKVDFPTVMIVTRLPGAAPPHSGRFRLEP